MKPIKCRAERGFTLVELAIVIVIIGLLVGGVIKGTELIGNAKVNKVITQVKSYYVAVQAFQDKYNYMPGDFLFAMNSLPECTAANFCENGGGNGKVDNNVPNNDPHWAENVVGWPETIQFWKHLAMADMITGIDISANPANLEIGRTHPAAPFGGGYEFYFDPVMVFAGGSEVRTGNNIRWSREGPLGGTIGATAARGTITPDIAAQIDRKVDDGMPHSGWITANYGLVADTCKTSAGYVESTTTPSCNMYFTLQ